MHASLSDIIADAVGGFDSIEGLGLAREFLTSQEEALQKDLRNL